MIEKRFRVEKQIFDGYCIVDNHFEGYYAYEKQDLEKLCETLNDLNDENERLQTHLSQLAKSNREGVKKVQSLAKENEQLKEGMIGVVDRYIKNVDYNPPSSTHTYMKIKGALMNVREDLRDLIEDLE